MSIESEKFFFGDVQPNWIESKEITSHGQPAEPVRTGIRSVDVSCKTCGHTWTAKSYGEGAFTQTMGGAMIRCPSCHAGEAVAGLR